MAFELQFARITCFGKLPDRFLSSQHSKSQELAKSSMGEVFSMIEILSPWYNSAQIGQMIINNFANQYYQDGSTSDLVNFENALKKINENLAQITQNGETEWIGNLNGILAAIVGESLLLSPSGKADAYLFRDGKVNHLTQGLTDKTEIHPLKTFSNIVSGQLKNHDKIILVSKNLFNHISLESLRQIMTLNNATAAGMQIAKLLRKNKIKNVNAVIINLISKEELENDTLKEKQENVFYLDKTNESVLTKLKTFWQTILSPVGKIIASKVGGGVSSLAKKGAVSLKRVLPEKQAKGKTIDKTIEPEKFHKTVVKEPISKTGDRFQEEFILKESRDDNLLKDEEIKYSPDFYIHYYQEKKTKKENKLIKVFKFISSKIKNTFKWLAGLYTDKNKRKYFYIILAIILILIISLTAGCKLSGKGNLGNIEAQKILDEAIGVQKEAKKALSDGKTEEAKEKFALSIDKARSITKNPIVNKDAQATIAGSWQELDKLTSTTRFNKLEQIVTIDEPAKAIFMLAGQAYIIGENDIYKASLLGGKPQKIASIPKNKGGFICGATLGNTLYLYTNGQNLFEFNSSSDKIEAVKTSSDGRWETANSIAGYVGSLYLLDGVLGQIYKHSSGQEEFAKGEEYLPADSTNKFKESISLAIDGSIYLLNNQGEVLKLQRSKLQDFSLKNIPTPWDKIKNPRKIYTDSDTPSLYILENHSNEDGDLTQARILEFDKEGTYIRQYALPEEFDKVTDFNVSVKSKKIWILNNDSLYEIAI